MPTTRPREPTRAVPFYPLRTSSERGERAHLLDACALAQAQGQSERVRPALYLQAVAARSRESARRRALTDQARQRMAPLSDEATSPLMERSEAAVAHLLDQGREWVARYVRASSCVEGRNGQRSRRHPSLPTLGETKLAARTGMPNVWSQRDDGTTAAERFFEPKPCDLFEWLLDVLPDRPWPAQKRPRVAPSPLRNGIKAMDGTTMVAPAALPRARSLARRAHRVGGG